MIRPRPARWFELLVARDDATLALEALAGTGAIELEARPTARLPAALADLRRPMQQFSELALRYHDYWPGDGLQPSAFPEPAVATLERCLAQIRGWAQDAEPVVGSLQRADAERDALVCWKQVLEALAGSRLDLARLAGAGPFLHARLFVFASASAVTHPSGPLIRRFEAGGRSHALAVGTADDMRRLVQQANALKARVQGLPAWLQRDWHANEVHVATRLAELEHEAAAMAEQLAALADRHGLRRALGDAARLQWVLTNVHALEAGELFCWITGWTSDFAGQRLASAL
ncbi:MAG TPA: hypothetical protein VGV08_08060, partial [Casimicrobiaceae bacterium]|nr:hypothetical protein [Casimicrobiaceae bacterium]